MNRPAIRGQNKAKCDEPFYGVDFSIKNLNLWQNGVTLNQAFPEEFAPHEKRILPYSKVRSS